MPKNERIWYAAPYRIRPGVYVPGRVIDHDLWGLSDHDMRQLSKPGARCREAAEAARDWRKAGKKSDIWLVLAVDGVCTHCVKYDETKHEET